MDNLNELASDPRVTVRRGGPPDPAGTCVVYWMQRAQRGFDNHALDIAVEAANALGKPVVVFFAPVPFYPHVRTVKTCVSPVGIFARSRRTIHHLVRKMIDHAALRQWGQARRCAR